MTPELKRILLEALERSHRLGMIGGDLEEQLAHCASFSSVLGQVTPTDDGELRGADLGTGGGLPGVALALLWPTMAWTLIDMRAGRATEVERTILALAVHDRVDVRTIEAQRLGQEAGARENYDVAVARAFGQPSLTAECASGLLRPGGVFLVSEPPELGTQERADRWDPAGLEGFGLSLPQFIEDGGNQFAAMTKLRPLVDAIPRLPPRPNRGWITGR